MVVAHAAQARRRRRQASPAMQDGVVDGDSAGDGFLRERAIVAAVVVGKGRGKGRGWSLT